MTTITADTELATIELGQRVADELYKPAPVAPADILTGAVTLMQARGRAFGNFEELNGSVCALGGMAMAAGRDADHWDTLHSRWPHWLEHGDAELIEAGRLLVQVIAPWHEADKLTPEDVIEIVGDWHDGPKREHEGKTVYPMPPLNSTVFEALAKAAEAVAR